ncbi:hypothetical protein EN852_027735 [Mesorhizobium sp. M2E.F.Ca.ET.209.01.1.1]|uniref:hypothetical protein n=1 Tax=Mesorhizobium sp. M2E.F.Ca.ET.209.01.1.1 TaxID=2500526 RepID=UPI000FD703AD|nr:hypothetical protein [Mesorhizobium sp. M2E.F.Ca.ET.209.01.1.1]TGS10244.1 hypothetical protein EN852_027735 [Mesorhizobium sp. M2E.F.Ca.ET.209.01.1.1]
MRFNRRLAPMALRRTAGKENKRSAATIPAQCRGMANVVKGSPRQAFCLGSQKRVAQAGLCRSRWRRRGPGSGQTSQLQSQLALVSAALAIGGLAYG